MQAKHVAWFGGILGSVVAALGAASAAADEQTTETIVVTGSHIATTTFSSPAPVTTIDASQIAAVGAKNVGEFLARMPQAVGIENNSTDVFATTSSGLQLTSLRNLGEQRTLVLVNGRRFVSGESPDVGYGVDLNAIPVTMIDHIEILTGGASAVYGSDAVAGVVNIILRKNFQGVEVNGQAGTPQEGDRNRQDADVTMGGNFADGDGNAWLSYGYSRDEGLMASDRNQSKLDIFWFPPDTIANTGKWGYVGSSFVPQGRFGDRNGDGTLFDGAVAVPPDESDRFNRASQRQLASPVDRKLLAGGSTYDFNPTTHGSIEMNYSNVDVTTQLEPFPLDLYSNVWHDDRGGTGGMSIDSPLIPPALRAGLEADYPGIENLNELGLDNTARRLVEFGDRGSNIERQTARVAGDLKFDLNDTNTFDVSVVWGQTEVHQQDNVGINSERAALALDVEVDPADPSGQTLRCVDAAARLQGCVPFDVFGRNTISQAAVAYLKVPQNLESKVEQAVVTGGFSGDTPWHLPGGVISYAAGLEYREEKGQTNPDSAAVAGITTSNKELPTRGDFDVTELYAELRLPVLEKLIVDAAYRVGNYSTVNTIDTWKVGLDMPVLESVRLRATISQSVRAPNVADLYAGATENFDTVTDVCDGVTNATPGVIAENCRSVAAIQNRITKTGAFTLTQVEKQATGGFDSGNPNVQEETADSWTGGVVFTPSFVEHLSVAIDYYDIHVKDAIGIVSRDDTILHCYNEDPAVFLLDQTCGGSNIRDVNSGALTEVNTHVSNIEDYYVSGADAEVAYNVDLDNVWHALAGRMDVHLLYSWLGEWKKKAKGEPFNPQRGEVEFPENRASLMVQYLVSNWTVNWRLDAMGSVVDGNRVGDNADIFGDPLYPVVVHNPENGVPGPKGMGGANRCAARFYNSLQLGYDFTEKGRGFIGINNLLDQDACTLGQGTQYGAVGINTDPAMYDVTGRDYYIGFQVRL